MSFDFAVSARIDALNNVLLEAMAADFPHMEKVLATYRNDDGDMDAAGLINARRVIGKLLREALKSGVVLADPPRAKVIAHNGAAGHSDTAADLQPLGIITVPPDTEEVRLP